MEIIHDKKDIQDAGMGDYRVILHDIRSTHNVGSMFRTSDAAGISKIYISGYTPAPVDQFKRKRKDIAKTALGAEDSVGWEQIQDIKKLLINLKQEGFQIIGVEQNEKSIDYKKVNIGTKAVILMGSEVEGISSELLSYCDSVAEIPMRGGKESLNVSVAFGIALFRMFGI